MNKKLELLTSESNSDYNQYYFDAFYDQVSLINENTIVISGWERASCTSHGKLNIKHDKQGINIIEEFLVRYKRPDVNDHFSDPDQKKWGVLRVISFDVPVADTNDIKFILSDLKQDIKVNFNANTNYSSIVRNLSLMSSKERLLAESFLINQYGQQLIKHLYHEKIELEKIDSFIKFHIENSFLINDYGIFIQGWLIDSNESVIGIYVKQGNFISTNLKSTSNFFLRPDVCESFPSEISNQYKAGFYGIAEHKSLSGNQDLELVIITDKGQINSSHLTIKQRVDDEIGALHELLAPINIDKTNFYNEFDGFIGKAIEHLWKTKNYDKNKVSIRQYGTTPKNPTCSLIIPIYGRCDFILYQIAQFSKDSDLKKSEIIYILDDPNLEYEFNNYCAEVFDTFGVPFITVYSGYNLGYSGANNIASNYATSDILLLLNSDVLPKQKNWLSDLVYNYKNTKNIGVLGCRLLFEDDTIQHDGLEYQKSSKYHDLWLIDHPGKGLPEWMVQQKGLHQTHAVTGACLMINADLYKQLNGLDENYILGDFEDSDLCLKCLEAGYQNYLDSNTKLYHLERQSQNLFEEKTWKFKLTLYNGVRHTKKWDQFLKNLKLQD